MAPVPAAELGGGTERSAETHNHSSIGRCTAGAVRPPKAEPVPQGGGRSVLRVQVLPDGVELDVGRALVDRTLNTGGGGLSSD